MSEGRETNQIADVLRKVPEGNENSIQVVRELTKGKDDTEAVHTTLSLQRRKLNPEEPPDPKRRESPPRQYQFTEITGLIDYLIKQEDKTNMVLLADVASRHIDVILDDDAETGREVMTLGAALHPLYQPWYALIHRDKKEDPLLTLPKFVEFLTAYRRSIVEPAPGPLLACLAQVRCSSEFTLHVGRGKDALNGVTCKTKIEGAPEQDELINIPDVITIEVPLFVNTETKRLEIDVTLTGTTQEIHVTLTCADMLVKETEVFGEMLEMVKEKVSDAVVAHGRYQAGNWAYLGG